MVSAIVGALAPVAQAGEATTTVRDHRTSTAERDHRTTPVVRDHRTTTTTVRDHRTQRRNEVVVVDRPKLECEFGFESLQRQGYSFVRPSDCEGVKYLYTAVLGDKFFHAEMNAYSGEFEFTIRGFVH